MYLSRKYLIDNQANHAVVFLLLSIHVQAPRQKTTIQAIEKRTTWPSLRMLPLEKLEAVGLLGWAFG